MILATNVAETSLTIPNVTTVIDLGMVKQKRHDPTRGVDLLTLTTISRSAATQRAGRAGRTAPGHVYRLYTEAQLDGFESEPPPEILRTDLASALLQLKAMGIRRLLSIDWLDPPEPDALTRAIKHLYKTSTTFKKLYKEFIKKNKSVNNKNFADKFRESTGKSLKLGASPASWYKVLVSAMHEIERRLEV